MTTPTQPVTTPVTAGRARRAAPVDPPEPRLDHSPVSFFGATFVVFRRQLRLALRNPAWVVIGLLQPILYLTLFGPLLEPLAGQLGTVNAYTLFVPGLLVQLGLFGALFAGFGLIGEYRDGVIEGERVTPASRTALLLGRVLRDVLQLFVQGVVLILLGLAFGLDGSVPGMILGLVLVLLVGAACSSASYALALATKSEDALAPILNLVTMPVLLLSGILLPMTLGPKWLQTVSDVLPTKHIVDAVRAVFRGDFWTPETLWGTVWAVVLTVAGLWVGTRTFRRQNA
jgi:ABC-2 type transport system permease protein